MPGRKFNFEFTLLVNIFTIKNIIKICHSWPWVSASLQNLTMYVTNSYQLIDPLLLCKTKIKQSL